MAKFLSRGASDAGYRKVLHAIEMLLEWQSDERMGGQGKTQLALEYCLRMKDLGAIFSQRESWTTLMPQSLE